MVTGLVSNTIHTGSSAIEALEIAFSFVLVIFIGITAFLVFMDAPMSESALNKLDDEKKELAHKYVSKYGKPITRMNLFKLGQERKRQLLRKNEKEKQERLLQMQKSQLEKSIKKP